MKKLAIVCLCLILASFIVAPNKAAYSQARNLKSHEYVEGELLIKLKAEVADISDEMIPDLVLRAPGAQVERLGGRMHSPNLIRLNGRLSVEQAVEQAQADPRVEYAQPNYIYRIADTRPNDPAFGQQWGLLNPFAGAAPGVSPADIGATRAWDITTGSDDVVVAVVDTGIDINHPDLAPNIWVNPGEIPNNGLDDDHNGLVDDVNGWDFFRDSGNVFDNGNEDDHATHVAGTIGAVGNNGVGVSGVAWHVRLMSLKFLHDKIKKGKVVDHGVGSTADAVSAINYAVDEKLHHNVNVRAINASWGGGPDDPALRQAIAAAGNAGIVFVCAAGNDGGNIDETPDFPAAYARDLNNVISVAAMDASDFLAFFSNYGHQGATIGAPGVSIESTWPVSRGSYHVDSGTSMASPHVAGVVALLASLEPQLTPAQIRQRLVTTAEPTDALASRVSASGRVNAFNALTNHTVPADRPRIVDVNFGKTTLTLDGFGFINGSAIIEIGGVAVDGTVYDRSYAVGNGTLTHLSIVLGKKPMKKKFPISQPVTLTVLNPTTGERSATFTTTRF
jgi:subtilisin family serine protease